MTNHKTSNLNVIITISIGVGVKGIAPTVPAPTNKGEYDEYRHAYHAWYKNEIEHTLANLTEDQIHIDNPEFDIELFSHGMDDGCGSGSLMDNLCPNDWKDRFIQKIKTFKCVKNILLKYHVL